MTSTLETVSPQELGRMLVAGRAAIDAAEAEWLRLLLEFDERCGWSIDGHVNCVTWLVDHCGLSRPAAKDRLRVARALPQRPLLAEALAAGTVSYSKVRALTRIHGTDEQADEALLVAAHAGTAADMERLARHYQLQVEQDTPPPDNRWENCGMRVTRRYGGTATIEIVVPVEDSERLMAIVDASVKALTVADTAESTGPVDTRRPWTERRADTLLQLAEAGLAHLADGGEVDPEKAVINVIADYDTLIEAAPGTAELDGGIPLSGEAARRLACDAGVVRVITRGASEILDVGRKTREWTTPQRRAIRFRFGGRCAFPACELRITQIHHCDPWGKDGETNLDCGVPVCHQHHKLVHEGKWTVGYDPNRRAAIFTSPKKIKVIAPTPGTLKWAA